MMNMIRADFYRIAHSKAVYAGIAVLLLIIGISIYSVSPGYIGMTGGSYYEDEYDETFKDMNVEQLQTMSASKYREIMLQTEGYELDRDILASNMNLYYVFIFVISAVIVADFSGRTAKNTLSSAISRNKYFFSKAAMVNFCCIVLFLLNTCLVYFCNIAFNGKNLASDLGTLMKINLIQLPPILALVSILAGLAFILKKSAVFNTVAIPLALLIQIVLSVSIRLFKFVPEKLLDYEFQNMIYLLANNPSANYLVRSYLLCGGIIIAFYLAGYLVFLKSEIK